MKLNHLVATIASTPEAMRNQAAQSVNAALTIRNWLIGYYIVEFEQKGEDRAKYGDRLLETLSQRLEDRRLKGMSLSMLKVCRDFYKDYPQISRTVSGQIKHLSDSLISKISYPVTPISRTVSGQLAVAPHLLVERLSFSHPHRRWANEFLLELHAGQ